MSKLTIITRDGDLYTTDSTMFESVLEESIAHYTIEKDSYMLQESVRIVKFTNKLGERITIPFENINSITEKGK
jgi:hypothetical protein